MEDPKTTIAGVMAILTIISTWFAPQYLHILASITGLFLSTGLIAAQDAKWFNKWFNK